MTVEAIKDALADLKAIDDALDELYDGIYALDWMPESIAGRSTGHRSRVLFTNAYTTSGDALYPLRAAYDGIARELYQAGEALMKTPVPSGIPPKPRPSVPNVFALRTDLDLIVLILRWLAGEDLDSADVTNLEVACAHIRAAREHITELQPPKDNRRGCANTPCPNKARANGTQCGTCANYRSRRGHDRPIEEEDVA